MKKRRLFNIDENTLEAYQYQNNKTPMANKVSGQRLQLVRSQEEASIPPINATVPKVESTMAQEMLTKSSSIRKLRGKITFLAKFSFQDITFYFYKQDGIVHVLEDTKYVYDNGFATPMKTDFIHLQEGMEYDLDDDGENFMLQYPCQYNPVSQTVGYGANVTTAITTVRANALDAIDMSESAMLKFGVLRDKKVNINLTKKKIISSYENLFPPLGEFINEPKLCTIVKDDNTVASMAHNPKITAGYEDDSIILEPFTFINRIEVFSNYPIDNNPVLEKYRLELREFRQNVYEFITSLTDPYDPWVDRLRGNYESIKNRNGSQLIKDPLITLYTKTVSMPETESKFNVDLLHGNMWSKFGSKLEPRKACMPNI